MNSGVVVIKTENGPVRIDASDYDQTKHELHVADDQHDENGIVRNNDATLAPLAALAAIALAAPETGEATAPIDASARYAAFGVLQNKNKFFIVDGANGGKVVDDVDGIDPKGYSANTDAWKVLLDLKAKPATDNA